MIHEGIPRSWLPVLSDLCGRTAATYRNDLVNHGMTARTGSQGKRWGVYCPRTDIIRARNYFGLSRCSHCRRWCACVSGNPNIKDAKPRRRVKNFKVPNHTTHRLSPKVRRVLRRPRKVDDC